ncbi:MAG: hypothetical protein ACRDMY_03885 [Gaiellaceae bacterium]
MSDLGDLLELLHSARGRYRTVRGVLRQRSNLHDSERAHERWEEAMHEAGKSVGTSYAMLVFEDGTPSRSEGRHELVVRFWSEPPARMREETTGVAPQDHEHVLVRDGGRWWSYSPHWGAVSNVAAGAEAEEVTAGGGELWPALLDPSGWIPVFDFEVEGEVELMGRSAVRVQAIGRGASCSDDLPFVRTQLPLGADEYRLDVDRERGVVLRAAALLDGEEFWISAFEELVFDEKLPRETFAFEPPPGVEVREPDVGLHEPVTIEEAARRATFPLFYIPELPEGRWDLDVLYVPASERPQVRESVHLAYHRADATHHLMVAQRPAGRHEPDWAPYAPEDLRVEKVERGDLSFTIYRPERKRQGIPLTVIFEREATAIELSSTNVDEEVLLRLAASMERVG